MRSVGTIAPLPMNHAIWTEPIGETLLLSEGREDEPATIVGVAADVRHEGYIDDRPDQIYRPLDEVGSRGRFFVVRTFGPPEEAISVTKRPSLAWIRTSRSRRGR